MSQTIFPLIRSKEDKLPLKCNIEHKTEPLRLTTNNHICRLIETSPSKKVTHELTET